MLLAASLFSVGIILFLIIFFRHGVPSDEAIGADVSGDLVPVGK
jgi:hypothetical protein